MFVSFNFHELGGRLIVRAQLHLSRFPLCYGSLLLPRLFLLYLLYLPLSSVENKLDLPYFRVFSLFHISFSIYILYIRFGWFLIKYLVKNEIIFFERSFCFSNIIRPFSRESFSMIYKLTWLSNASITFFNDFITFLTSFFY